MENLSVLSGKTNSKKSLMFLCGELTNGGQERQLFYLIHQLKHLGYNVSLIVWNYRSTDWYANELDNLQIPNLKLQVSFRNNYKIRKARQFLAKQNPVTLQSFAFYLNFFSHLICIGYSTIPIGAIRNRLKKNKDGMTWTKFLSCVAFPFHKISNNYLYSEGFSTIFNRIFLGGAVVVTNKLRLQDYLPVTKPINGLLQTCSISRLFPEKRVRELVLLICKLKKSGIPIRHTHAGDGPLRSELEKLVRELGIGYEFTFAGQIKDINNFFTDKHLMLHSSFYEGFPNAIMEAMAAGLPIIATDTGDTRFLVKDGENGYLIPTHNINVMEQRIIELSQSPEILKQMGIDSRKKAEILFSFDEMSAQTLNAYLAFGAKI